MLPNALNAMACFSQAHTSAEVLSNCNSGGAASRIKIVLLLLDSSKSVLDN